MRSFSPSGSKRLSHHPDTECVNTIKQLIEEETARIAFNL
jgi:hypothetical protein